MTSKESAELVQCCLYNWLGYGNPQSSTWFIGMEEGGAEIWKHKRLTLEESLAIRSQFKMAVNFQTVWKELYGYGKNFKDLVAGHDNVWRYISALLLYQDDIIGPHTDKGLVENWITNFLLTKFGRKSASHFFCDFLPLPRPNPDNMPALYRQVWPTVSDYYNDVMPKRFYLIIRTLLKNDDLEQVISFDKTFTKHFLHRYPVNEKEGKRAFPSYPLKQWAAGDGKRYALYSVKLENGRAVLFLDSPFFGRMGYGPIWYEKKGLPYAAIQMKENLVD